jgi:hypothetical protein
MLINNNDHKKEDLLRVVVQTSDLKTPNRDAVDKPHSKHGVKCEWITE